MKVDVPPRSVKPRCHNRPDFAAERTVFSIEEQSGFVTGTTLKNSWFKPGCKTWEGVGIGQPTPEFPAGTPYPIAHGFDCRGCRHLPAEFEALA